MTWSTRDLGFAAYLETLGGTCCGVKVQRDQWDRPIGFFVFDSEPTPEQIASWVNRTARVEPQALLYAMRGLKHNLFKEMGER